MFKQAFIAELKFETANSRKLLERVPTEKNDWKPHAKSMALGRLASHVAEIPNWITTVLTTDELDLSKRDFKPHIAATSDELVAILDEKVSSAVQSLEQASDAEYDKMWTLRNGDHVIFSMPKKAVLRNLAFNHHYHHRAQLGVYLRLLDVPIPGMYGPTADDVMAPAPKPATA